MTYSEYVNAIADLLILLETITDATSATPSTDVNFNTILPRAIEYAEQRMYRELDLLQTTESDTATTSSGSRSVTIPSGFIVVQSVYVVTPAGSAPTDPTASVNPLSRISLDGLNIMWPQGQVTGDLPTHYANFNNSTIYLAPAPDDTYTVQFFGTRRPTALSSSNTSTILTTYIPDVFIACSMVFLAGYQRDFGSQADDPKLAQSWEAQYQQLRASAEGEISRMKSQAQQWNTFSDAGKATSITRGS